MSEHDEAIRRAWLIGWREGDEESGEKLYELLAPEITRFFLSKMYDRTIVEDLTHETFLALRRTKTEVKIGVRAYAFGVAVNTLRRHLRGRARQNRHVAAFARQAEDIILNDLELDPEYVLNQRQEIRLLMKALRRLALDDQVTIELHFLKCIPRRELAVLFEISEGGMANRILRARRRLAAKILELETSPDVLATTSKSVATWLTELAEHLERMKAR